MIHGRLVFEHLELRVNVHILAQNNCLDSFSKMIVMANMTIRRTH